MSLIRQQTEDQEYDYIFKIIIIGDSGVGKTNLLTRFARNEFSFESKPTIGVEFTAKTMVMNEKKIKLQLWDTAGQERYRAITKAYYKGALGAMIVFDLTRASTLTNIKKWFDEIKQHSDPNIAVLMVGNKSDLNEERVIPKKDATLVASEYQAAYLETSALTQENVQQAFEQLNNDLEIFKRFSNTLDEQKKLNDQTVKIEDKNEETPTKKGCC